VTDLPLIEPNLASFYEAWQWLCGHPYFRYNRGMARGEEGFADSFHIIVVKVDPRSLKIADDPVLNIETRVWVECGPWTEEDHPMHDPELDVGGVTFESAIITLAEKVMERHGDYPEWAICSHCLMHYPSGPTDPDEEWFHSPECEKHGAAGLRTRPVEGRDDVVQMIPLREIFDCEHFPSSASVETSPVNSELEETS